MLEKDRLIKTSRFVVRTGFIVNRLFLAAVALGLILSSISPPNSLRCSFSKMLEPMRDRR